jgi:hypothetical protein
LTQKQNVSNYNVRRPMGAYYQGVSLDANIGTSNYHAMVVSLQRQLGQQLTFLGGFRWSRCMSTSDPGGGFNSDTYATPVRGQDYGKCVYDVRDQVKVSAVWKAPDVRLHAGILDSLLSKWQANGILSLRTGQPFTVLSGVDNSTSGIGQDRADQIGNPYFSGSRSHAQAAAAFFNVKAFQVNALGTYGNTSRDFLIGPGYKNLDLSISKMFQVGSLESQRIQFRAEAFNLGNRVNFNNPNANISSKNAGLITSASDPRILQFALKYIF